MVGLPITVSAAGLTPATAGGTTGSNGDYVFAYTAPATPGSFSVAATVGGDTAYIVGGYTGSRWLGSILAFTPGRPVRTVGRLPQPLRYAAGGGGGGGGGVGGGGHCRSPPPTPPPVSSRGEW